MTKKAQIKLVNFALKHQGKWHSYTKDYHTVNLIAACVNLGIIKLNKHDQFALASRSKALRFIE